MASLSSSSMEKQQYGQDVLQVKEATLNVHQIVEMEVENGTDPLRIALEGFSQVIFNL